MTLPRLAAIVPGLVILGAATHAQVNPAQVRQQKNEEATVRGVLASIDRLKNEASKADQMAAVMLGDVAGHQQRQVSYSLLLRLERARLTDAVRQQLQTITKDMPDLPASWVERVMTDHQARIDSTVQSILAGEFDDVYSRARNTAIQVHRTKLAGVLKPSLSEVEALAAPVRDFVALPLERVGEVVQRGGAPLISRQVAKAIAGRAYFEENRLALESDAAAQVTGELGELWRQVRYAQQHDGGGNLEMRSIAAAIAGDVERIAGEHVLFPSVAAAITERAGVVERDRFLGFLSSRLDSKAQGGCPALPGSEVVRVVGTTYRGIPATLLDHVQRLNRQLAANVVRTALDGHIAAVEDASARQRLRQRLAVWVQSSEDPAGFRSRIRECIQFALRPLREELARKELAAVAPRVVDLSLEFSDEVLAALILESPGSAGNPAILDDSRLALEESRRLFQELRQELLTEAREAALLQVSLPERPERKTKLVSAIQHDRDRSERRKRFWADTYRREVMDAWRTDREQILFRESGVVRHPEKYDRLFMPTTDRIDEIITTEFSKPVDMLETRTERLDDTGGGEGGGEGSGRSPGLGGGGGSGCPPCQACPTFDDERRRLAAELGAYRQGMQRWQRLAAWVATAALIVGLLAGIFVTSRFRRGTSAAGST